MLSLQLHIALGGNASLSVTLIYHKSLHSFTFILCPSTLFQIQITNEWMNEYAWLKRVTAEYFGISLVLISALNRSPASLLLCWFTKTRTVNAQTQTQTSSSYFLHISAHSSKGIKCSKRSWGLKPFTHDPEKNKKNIWGQMEWESGKRCLLRIWTVYLTWLRG